MEDEAGQRRAHLMEEREAILQQAAENNERLKVLDRDIAIAAWEEISAGRLPSIDAQRIIAATLAVGPDTPVRVYEWNDQNFRHYIVTSAAQLGLSVPELYQRAGLHPSGAYRPANRSGRTTRQFTALATALQTNPLELLNAGMTSYLVLPTDLKGITVDGNNPPGLPQLSDSDDPAI